MRFRHRLAIFFIGLIACLSTSSSLAVKPTQTLVQRIRAQAPNLSAHVIELALKGYDYAKAHSAVTKKLLTIVDFSKPSYQKRLWVIDLKKADVLLHTYVANGKNSGLVYATRFSNRPHSYQSSLGVYLTQHTYFGHHGYSLRLNGLEDGINDNALSRDIVMHSAWYVTKNFINRLHRAGRSWGCFALSPTVSRELIHTIEGGSVLFAYASQENQDANLA